MATIDILMIIAFGIGAVIGFMKGFIKQLASIFGVDCRFVGGKSLVCRAGRETLPTVTDSMTFAQILAFSHYLDSRAIGIYFGQPLCSRHWKLYRWVVNRWLGSGLGALKYLLLVSLLVGVIEFVDEEDKLISKTKRRSRCYIIR